MPEQRITPLHIAAAAACGLALAVDMIEMVIGTAFSTVFLAPPYNMGTRELSFLVSSVYLGAVAGAPVFGWASDRRGIRICLVVALCWLGVTSLLAAGSPTTLWLGVLRFLSGLALGAIPPLLIAYLTSIAPPDRRGLLIFWVCGLAALAPPAAIMTIRWLLPLEPWGVSGWRWPLVGGGLLALLACWAFTRLPDADAWPHRTTRKEIAARRLGPHGALSSLDGHKRRLTFISAIYFLLPWAAVGFPLLTGPILLLRGFDVSRALLYVALTTIGPTIASLITGAFVDRLERRSTLAGCAILMGAAVLVFAFSLSPVWVVGALVTFGIAAAIYVTALTIYAAEVFPAEIRTFTTSTAWACNRAAAVIVPVVLLALIRPEDSPLTVMPIVAAIAASLLLIGFGPRGAARRVLD